MIAWHISTDVFCSTDRCRKHTPLLQRTSRAHVNVATGSLETLLRIRLTLIKCACPTDQSGESKESRCMGKQKRSLVDPFETNTHTHTHGVDPPQRSRKHRRGLPCNALHDQPPATPTDLQYEPTPRCSAPHACANFAGNNAEYDRHNGAGRPIKLREPRGRRRARARARMATRRWRLPEPSACDTVVPRTKTRHACKTKADFEHASRRRWSIANANLLEI